ncbi:MAG TPA: NMD3-related protein, partial [Thermoplasmataceae archaeon]|nr:NMD3-related protein [Thermoplasmataceae archaeon]
MICVRCGRNEAIERGLCESCLKDVVRIRKHGNLDVIICPKCGSVRLKNSWIKSPTGNEYRKEIESLIEIDNRGFKLTVVPGSVELDPASSTVTFQPMIEGEKFHYKPERSSIEARITRISCPSCNKITGSHYEAILQIRSTASSNTPLISEVFERALSIMDKMSGNSKLSYVSKVVRLKEGVDIYLGRKSDAEKLAKEISGEYFSQITVNKKLSGRMEGYDTYRYTFLLRLLDLSTGSIITRGGDRYIVERVSSSTLVLINPESEERMKVQRNEFYNSGFSFTKESAEVRRLIVINSRSGETELMDPSSFRSYTVKLS